MKLNYYPDRLAYASVKLLKTTTTLRETSTFQNSGNAEKFSENYGRERRRVIMKRYGKPSGKQSMTRLIMPAVVGSPRMMRKSESSSEIA